MKKLAAFFTLLTLALPFSAFATTYATWNASDKSALVSLSNGNLTVKNTVVDGQVGVRSTISKSSGKWYWEIKMDSLAGDVNYGNGIANGSANLSGQPYYTGGGAYVINDYAGTYDYAEAHQESYFTAFVSGDVLGVALDAGANTVTFYKNGVVGPTAKTVPAATYYAGAFPYRTADQITANFGATAFAYTVPTGYCAGLVDVCPSSGSPFQLWAFSIF